MFIGETTSDPRLAIAQALACKLIQREWRNLTATVSLESAIREVSELAAIGATELMAQLNKP